MFHTCVSVWKITGYMHIIIGLAVIKIRNINKSLISLVGLHFLAAQHLQSTLHNQHSWHHGGKVPAIKLALDRRSYSYSSHFTPRKLCQYPYSALFIRMTGISTVSEFVCQQVDCQWVDVSASWFVCELSCQRVVLSASWLSASWFVSEMSVKPHTAHR